MVASESKCSERDYWLDDETLFAYFIVTASLNDSIVALDPILTMTAKTARWRLSSYPLGSGKKGIFTVQHRKYPLDTSSF